jgi:hypothetical protein
MLHVRNGFYFVNESGIVITATGTAPMSDIVFDVELNSEADDARLSEAIDSFLSLQVAGAPGDVFDLDLMVRTVFGPGGERLKQIIFQQHELASSFSSFWTAFRGVS